MADELIAPSAAGEKGMTLVELMVAMGLFIVLLTIIAGGIVSFSGASTQSRIDTQTSAAVGVAFQRIERSVRYANSINYPGVSSGSVYVEWRTDAVSAPSGVTTCTQLRYSATAGTIAMRSWVSGSAASTGGWTVILSGVFGSATASYPFITIGAGANSNYQGLTVSVGTGRDANVGTTTSVTYYAKNSSVDSTSNSIDATGQSQIPVCNPSGYRP